MQYRRNFQRFANSAQPRTGFGSGFRQKQPGFGAGDGGATGFDNQDILFNQLFGKSNMAVIMLDFGIIASHYTGNPFNVPFLYGIQQGIKGAAEGGKNRLHTEAGHELHFFCGNKYFLFVSPGVIFDSSSHYFPGNLQRFFLVKGNMLRAGELCLR